MALNQKLLKEKLEAWSKVTKKLEKASGKKNKALDPLIKEHNEKIAPIIKEYEAAVMPLNVQWNALSKEIEAMLTGNVDSEGSPKPVSVESESATVALTKSEGARMIQVQKFFDLVKNKTASFWDCLTVQIGKADKLIGKAEVDKISDKKTTYAVNISLKK